MDTSNPTRLLEVQGLKTIFHTRSGVVHAVNDLTFSIGEGEILGVVGESGSGKSVTAHSIMRLIPEPPGEIISGQIMFEGVNLLALSEREMREYRGLQISMMFQDPMSSLNPTSKIGVQVSEMLQKHLGMSHKESRSRTVALLEQVGIPDPIRRANSYPHQLSGGMRQRVMIAIALSCSPKLLIADEPTTALDVTIQAQILELITSLRKETGTAVLIITHDLGVIASVADRVVVMYGGQAVEHGDVDRTLGNPSHPYTRGLLKSTLRVDQVPGSELTPIKGSPPNLFTAPTSCSYEPRCNYSIEKCRTSNPHLESDGNGNHMVACWVELEPVIPTQGASRARG